MNKKKIIGCLTLLACTSLLTGTLFACSSGEEKIFQAEYGETFALPYSSEQMIVRDSAGREVGVVGGEFFVNDINGYSVQVGNHKNAISVKVADTKGPQINVEKNILYSSKNETVDFGKVTAYDAYSGEVEPVYTLVEGTTERTINPSDFTPEQTGVYTVKISAEDENENRSESTVYVDVSSNGKNGNKIANFSEVYAQEQVRLGYGLKAEYTTEMCYGDEKGSLKLTSSNDLNIDTAWSNYFMLNNLYKNDISTELGLYFRVYNNGQMSKTLKVGNASLYPLHVGEWTEVFISPSDFDYISERMGDKNYNRMTELSSIKFEFTTTMCSRTGVDEYYFSDIHVLPFVNAQTFISRLSALGDLQTQEKRAEYDSLRRIWSAYGKAARTSVNNYGYVNETKYGKLLAAEVLDKLYLDYHVGTSFVYDDTKIVYADSALGVKQFSCIDSQLSFEDKATFAAKHPGEQLPDENGFIKVRAGDTWGSTLKLEYPLCNGNWDYYMWKNIPVQAGEYTTNDKDSEGDSVYSKITFKVYCDPLSVDDTVDTYYGKELENRQLICSFSGQKSQRIKPGEWTEVTFYLDNNKGYEADKKKLRESSLYFYAENDVSFMTWITGATFYISSIYVEKAYTIAEVDTMMQEVIDKNLSADALETDTDFVKTKKALSTLSYFKRSKLTKKQAFYTYIENKLSQKYGYQEDENTLLRLDTAIGLCQISTEIGRVSYLERTEINANYCYENENGSLKLQVTGNTWKAGIHALLLPNEGKNGYSFYVYMEGSNGKKIQFVSWNRGSNAAPIVLEERKWTKITVPAGKSLEEDFLHVYCDDWKSKLPSGITLYLSAVKADGIN